MFFRGIIKLSIILTLFFGLYHYSDASFTISRPSTNNLGLAGHWTFDGKDMVNGVALDRSGSGNNGNLINIASSTFYAAGKIGQGFNFDGVDDYVNLGNPVSLQITGAMTVSAWVSFADITSALDAVTRDGDASDRGYRFFGENNGTICFYVATNATTRVQACTTTARSANIWYHVTGTYIPSTSVNIYVNGVFNNSNTTSVPASQRLSTASPRIGSRGDNTAYFKSNIDDVRVYNRALSANEIKMLYNQGVSKFNKTPTNILTSGLAGHWTFDGKDMVNGVALDRSGNGNNGNLINIATSTFYSAGKIGQGFDFDGTNDRIISSDSPSFDISSAITFSAWVYPTSLATPNRVIIWRDGVSPASDRYWQFYMNSGTGAIAASLFDTGDVSHSVTSNGTIALNTWTHVVATYDGAVMRIYINGAQDPNTTSSAFTIQTGTQNVALGSSDEAIPNYHWPGKIDDVRIYNRALSDNEVKALYNMGR